MKYKPLNNYILVKLVDDGERKTAGGLVVYDKQAVRVTKAKVLAVGNKVTTIKAGEVVLLPKHMNMEAGEVNEMILHEDDLEAVLEEA